MPTSLVRAHHPCFFKFPNTSSSQPPTSSSPPDFVKLRFFKPPSPNFSSPFFLITATSPGHPFPHLRGHTQIEALLQFFEPIKPLLRASSQILNHFTSSDSPLHFSKPNFSTPPSPAQLFMHLLVPAAQFLKPLAVPPALFPFSSSPNSSCTSPSSLLPQVSAHFFKPPAVSTVFSLLILPPLLQVLRTSLCSQLLQDTSRYKQHLQPTDSNSRPPRFFLPNFFEPSTTSSSISLLFVQPKPRRPNSSSSTCPSHPIFQDTEFIKIPSNNFFIALSYFF